MRKTFASVIATVLIISMVIPTEVRAADSAPILQHSGALSTLLDTTGSGLNNFFVSAPLEGSVHWRQGVPQTYEYGASWYSTMFPISTTQTQGLQIGLNGTWINADNRDKPDSLGQSMCKNGALDRLQISTARPDSENAGLVEFQTIEGGMGWWGPDKFPSIFPKYRLNVTQNCDQSQLGTPGWSFYGTPTPRDQTAVIQISNQIIMPPDGITFKPDFSGKQLGQNWQALNLPSFDHVYNNMAGKNNWTLFLNSENFKGPVAFIAPQYWSDGSLLNPAQTGLGLDHKAGMADQMSSEWQTIPYFTYKDSNNVVYSKIPDIQLPLDSNGSLKLGGEFAGYSQRNSLFDGAQVFNANLSVRQSPLYQGGIPIPSLQEPLTGKVSTDKQTYGLKFPNNSSLFPIGPYFKQVNGQVVPIAASEAPSQLINAQLPQSVPNYNNFDVAPDWWASSPVASKDFSVNLSDGSIAIYRWYKFVDQPALSRFQLSEQERNQLQDAVIQMQSNWKQNPLMAEPQSGKLVSLDSGVIVKPPTGLELGYVPIVIKQYSTATSIYLGSLAIWQTCSQLVASQPSLVCRESIAPTPTPIATSTPTPTPIATSTPTPTPIATSTPTPASNQSKPVIAPVKKSLKTIVCVKASTSKKISGINPKCPSGYKIKK